MLDPVATAPGVGSPGWADGMTAFLGGLPILVILVLMLGLRWSAGRAGIAGVAVSLLVAAWAFGFPAPVDPTMGLGAALGGTGAEAGFVALTILWIIGPALGIYELQERTGGSDVLRTALRSFAPDPRVLALLVAWFFVLFMEGAAGFGASVALAAPFLVSAGFRPVEAVAVTLVGHAVGVSFGAVGTPVVPQVAATGIGGLEIARATGIYHSLLGWLPLVVMIVMVNRSAPDAEGKAPEPGIVRAPIEWGTWGWTALAFVCFTVPYTVMWAFVGPELPTIAGALFGGAVFLLCLHLFGREPEGREEGRSLGTVLWAGAPYLVLVGLVLATRLWVPLRDVLRGPTLEWQLHGVFAGSMEPLYHPGTMLLAGFVFGAVLQRAGLATIVGAVLDATLRLLPVAVALTAMLLLSRIMVHSGMTEALAVAAASTVGGIWPVFAPVVGVLGTFVTGSATASNILFTDFQQETAVTVGLPVLKVVGGQGFGAAVGNMICPHNVVAAGATVGLHGREGEILRKTLPVTLLYTLAGGLLALWVL